MVIEKKIETSSSDLSNCSSPQKRSSPESPAVSASLTPNKSRDISLDSLVEAMDISSSSNSDSNSAVVPKLNGHCHKRPNSSDDSQKSEESDDSYEMTGSTNGNNNKSKENCSKVLRNATIPNGKMSSSSTAITNLSSVVLSPEANDSCFVPPPPPQPTLAELTAGNSFVINDNDHAVDGGDNDDPLEIYAAICPPQETDSSTQTITTTNQTLISILLNEDDKSAFSSQLVSTSGDNDEKQQQDQEEQISETAPPFDDANSPQSFSEIELPMSKLKTNFNELGKSIRFYLYVCDVFHSDSSYTSNSMVLYFQTTDKAFNEAHCPEDVPNPVYKLALNFPFGIIPADCSYQVKKKSIEIHLEKTSIAQWGSVGIKCQTVFSSSTTSPSSAITTSFTDISNNNISFKAAVASFAHNKWTPCAPGTSTDNSPETSPPSYFNNNNRNSLALVTYEEPIEPALNLDDVSSRGKFYGYTGLDNLGNTCFMNSVLQCLSNTYPLRDYFLSGKYQADINKENHLGTGGLIARAYAAFLKQMWMGKQTSFSPNRIKSLTGEKITSIFLGYGQHDAQEFMSFFLDAIHEDLNQNQNRPKINYEKEDEENPEKELLDERDLQDESKRSEIEKALRAKADEKWKDYLLFNNSLVIDLFCGQYQSVLSCPDCNKKSIMFDPFLYIPLPIPPAKTSYEVIFFGRDEATGACTGSARYEVLLAHNATAGDLLAQVAAKVGVPASKMRLIETQEDHISPKFHNSNWHFSDLRNDSSSSFKSRPLLVFEVSRDSAEDNVELCVIQRSLQKMQPKRFQFQFSSQNNDSRVGLPFIITVKRSLLTYHHLCSVICSYASHSVSAYRSKIVRFEDGSKRPASQVFTFNLNEFCRNFGSETGSSSTSTLSSSSMFLPSFLSFSSSSSLPSTSVSSSKSSPHFVHFETTSICENDILAPFVIRKPHLGGSPYVNTPEEEIVPPLIKNNLIKENEAEELEEDTEEMSSEESEASTVVGGGESGHSGDLSSEEGHFGVGQTAEEESGSSGFMSAASSERGDDLQEMSSFSENQSTKQGSEDDEDEDDKPEVQQPKAQQKQIFSTVQFNSDVPLVDQLNMVYYITADWIDVPGFPSGVGVNISESTNRNFVNFSNSNRNLLFGNNNNEEEEDDCITLDDCFELFSEPEVLGQQNCWKCPACRAPRAATKQLSFNLRRLPPVLVVQLKRFKMGGSMLGRRKLGQLVRFPLKGLDLKKTRGKLAVDLCGELSPQEEGEIPAPVYDLYAVVNHMGEAFMGHYTAYARGFDGDMGWRHFDDSCVSSVSDESRIVSANAYLLFYKRREKEEQVL